MVMCELRVVFKGTTLMEDVIRMTVEGNSIKLYSMLGETRTVQGWIVEVNLTKQEAIIEG
ncbi:MAG TPA: CooT family nickel-binding protein [Candidatus Methanoperedens sp.]